MVHSRPYHPQSQGKIASSHRALSSKMECDFFKMGKKGLNWAKALPECQRILNEEPKEVLSTNLRLKYILHANLVPILTELWKVKI